jgi:hypothetical protein
MTTVFQLENEYVQKIFPAGRYNRPYIQHPVHFAINSALRLEVEYLEECHNSDFSYFKNFLKNMTISEFSSTDGIAT